MSQKMDGASVCVKFGRLSLRIHQGCYDHAFHLAIRKVLYKPKEKKNSVENKNEEAEEEAIEVEENEKSDEDLDVDWDFDDDDFF